MNKDNYTFSSEYLRKKSALYQGLKRYEGYYGRRINHVPLRLAVAFAVCLILAASVMAASEFSFFSILKKDGKTVISIGSSQTGEAEPDIILDENGYYTFNSAFTAEGTIPSLILHRDYMPANTSDPADGSDIKFGDFDSGTAISFSAVYLGGKGYTYSFGNSAEIEDLNVNGHSAVIIRLDETTYFNKILAVYFEEHDVVIDCYLGYGIPDDEIIKLAEGLRLEETDDASLAWDISRNTGGLHHASSVPQSDFLPIQVAQAISLNDTVTLSEMIVDKLDRSAVDIEVTPTLVSVLDDVLALDESRCNGEMLSTYTDSDGGFIPYPRTKILNGSSGNGSSFGETENARKKLVLVTLLMKNTTDDTVSTCIGSEFNLHVGNSKDLRTAFVYNRTPSKYSTVSYPFYYDGGGIGKSVYMTDVSPGEEKYCTVGFLVDEDMLDEAYLLIGSASDRQYSLKLYK